MNTIFVAIIETACYGIMVAGVIYANIQVKKLTENNIQMKLKIESIEDRLHELESKGED